MNIVLLREMRSMRGVYLTDATMYCARLALVFLLLCLAVPSHCFQLWMQEEVLERSRMALRQSMHKLKRAFKQSKSNHLLYLALFVVGIFCIVYFWSKVYRTIRWFV